jgi:hypothetical protein
MDSFDKVKADTEQVEILFAEDYLQRFPLLKDKSEEEIAGIRKTLMRKLDYRFLPCVTMMLLMCYLDRINVANARLAGMQEDLRTY